MLYVIVVAIIPTIPCTTVVSWETTVVHGIVGMIETNVIGEDTNHPKYKLLYEDFKYKIKTISGSMKIPN
jgi:hypothetical protein